MKTRSRRYQVNLPEQQAECEANYHRLLCLLQGIRLLAVNDQRQYIIGNHPSTDTLVYFSIAEQTKYTTLVHIIQRRYLQNTALQARYRPETSSVHNNDNNNGQLNTIEASSTELNPMAYKASIRLYHDVNLAEVIRCEHHRQFSPRYEYPNDNMHQVNEKAQVNRFLSELLAHCLRYGRVDHTVSGQPLMNSDYV